MRMSFRFGQSHSCRPADIGGNWKPQEWQTSRHRFFALETSQTWNPVSCIYFPFFFSRHSPNIATRTAIVSGLMQR